MGAEAQSGGAGKGEIRAGGAGAGAARTGEGGQLAGSCRGSAGQEGGRAEGMSHQAWWFGHHAEASPTPLPPLPPATPTL